MSSEQIPANGNRDAVPSAQDLESVVRRATRRQSRFARITAGSTLVALGALALAVAVLLNRPPVRGASAAATGPAPLSGSQSPGAAGSSGGPSAQGAGPGNSGALAQRAYFSRTTPSGVTISATPLFETYPVPSCLGGGSAPPGAAGDGGSAPASTAATVVPDSGATGTASSPPAFVAPSGSAESVPFATTPLETLPPSGSGSTPACEPAMTAGLGQLRIAVTYGTFTGTFLSSDFAPSTGTAGGEWIEQAYTLPDGSRLVAASVSMPAGTATATLLSAEGATLDGAVGPTTGYAGPYSNDGWAILAALLPPGQDANAAPPLSLQLQLGTSSPFQLELPALPAPQAAGAYGTSVSGSWQAPQSAGSTTPQG